MKRLLDKLFNKHDNARNTPQGKEPAMSSEKPSSPPLPEPPWPLRFDSISFGARCYNTLRASIIYYNQELGLTKHLDKPSGPPRSADWKDQWSAGFTVVGEGVFPSPVKIKWTALDGIELRATVDLKALFPNREILHNVPREDVWEGWGDDMDRHAKILLEVNDRTINVYMKARVLTKHLKNPEDDPYRKISRNELILAWTHTY